MRLRGPRPGVSREKAAIVETFRCNPAGSRHDLPGNVLLPPNPKLWRPLRPLRLIFSSNDMKRQL
jgi:hypothetical protein